MFLLLPFVFFNFSISTQNAITSLVAFLEALPATFYVFQIACLMNYFWLCQMAWMVCEAVVLYKAVVVIMDPHVHRYMLKFNLFGWGQFN